MGPFSQPQWSSWAYSAMSDPFPSHTQFSNYPAYLADSLEAYQTHHDRLVQQQQMSRATESKPRLSKEEVEILESEFQKNHKPSSTTKKSLAETMRVDNARINNWFQNRRAREKKENNIREYEAKQRLEKERVEAGISPQPEKSRSLELVASSAPFPQPGSVKQSIETSQSPSEHSLPDSPTDATERSRNGDSDPLSPLPAVVKQEARDDDVDDYGTIPDHVDGPHFSSQDNCMLKLSTDVNDRFSFPDYVMAPNARSDADGLYDAESPSTEASDAKSPRALDLASRRDRRPAPLQIGGARSKTYATRTSDAGQITPMRIASGSGTGRVRKSVATPRSPFFDKTVDMLFHRRSSPRGSVGRTGSAAPPTPDTPVALQQHESGGACLSALYSLNGKYSPPDLVLSDPTLRTPPSTPGFSDDLYNLGTGYDLSISEETLIGPDMGRLHSVNLGSSAAMYGSYAPNARCSTQQMVPMFSTQLGQTYLNFVGAGTNSSEYDWSGLSPSTASTASNPPNRYMGFGHLDS